VEELAILRACGSRQIAFYGETLLCTEYRRDRSTIHAE